MFENSGISLDCFIFVVLGFKWLLFLFFISLYSLKLLRQCYNDVWRGLEKGYFIQTGWLSNPVYLVAKRKLNIQSVFSCAHNEEKTSNIEASL